MDNKTRPVRIALAGVGVLATLLFLAGPSWAQAEGDGGGGDATAEENGGGGNGGNGNGGNGNGGNGNGDRRVNASDGSVTSGSARAEDGSVSSGCASAEEDSTASGGDCKRRHDGNGDGRKKDHGKDRDGKARHAAGHETAGTATPVGVGGAEFALTGPSTGPLTAVAAALVGLGALLMFLTSDRRRATRLLS